MTDAEKAYARWREAELITLETVEQVVETHGDCQCGAMSSLGLALELASHA